MRQVTRLRGNEKMNDKITIKGTIEASSVTLTDRATVIVAVAGKATRDIGKFEEEFFITENGSRISGHTFNLEFSIARYNRMMYGRHGDITIIADNEEVTNFLGCGMPISRFHVTGGEPVTCPSIEELIKDFKNEASVIEALGGRDTVEEKRSIDAEDRRKLSIAWNENQKMRAVL